MKKGMFVGSLFVVVSLILLMFLINVGFLSAANPSREVNESFITGVWACNDQGWWDNGTTYVKDNCSYKASENNGIACCPGYQECNINGSCSGRAKYCYEYTNEYSCNRGEPKIISLNKVNYTCGFTDQHIDSDGCIKTYQCRCKWDPNSKSKTPCVDVLNVIPATADLEKICTVTDMSTCEWSTDILENNCNNSLNYLLVSKIAKPSGPAPPEGCTNITRQDTCPITTKLPFFGSFMMFVSICLIIVIYFFKSKNDKNVLYP
jgi:hypothetical protein